MRGLLIVLATLLTLTHSGGAGTTRADNKANLEDPEEIFYDDDTIEERRTIKVYEKFTEEQKQKIIGSVETNFLSMMDLKKRPKPLNKKKIVIPTELVDLYREQTGLDINTVTIPKPGKHLHTANTVRSFTHIESEIDSRFRNPNRFRLFFDVVVPKQEDLKASDLILTREHLNMSLFANITNPAYFKQKILVHDIVKPGIRGKSEAQLRILDTKLIDIREIDRIELDVYPAVERWIRQPKNNYGVIIEIVQHPNFTHSGEHVRLRRSSKEDFGIWASKQPVLYIYTDDGKNKKAFESKDDFANYHSRSKRATGKKSRGSHICRRHSLYVDFTDVGWNDWIVAPQGYDAYFCHGDCPFPLADHLNATNHAIVQTLANSVNPQTAPKACCVPTQLTSISMLYLDEENKVVLKNYQDMSVLGCGCR